MFVDITFLVGTGVCDYAAGNSAGHLANHDFLAARCAYYYSGMLILQTGFRKPCLVIVSILMFHPSHISVHRKPVGMYVHNRHENGNHPATVAEILVFLYFLINDNLSIGRSNHNVGGVSLKTAYGAAEKVQYPHINHCKNGCKRIKNDLWQADGVNKGTTQNKKQRATYECVVAFMVNVHFFYAFEFSHSVCLLLRNAIGFNNLQMYLI